MPKAKPADRATRGGPVTVYMTPKLRRELERLRAQWKLHGWAKVVQRLVDERSAAK